MLDRDLAELYGVETRNLKQAVRRNIDRFPEDFMFELSKEELQNWRSHFVISNRDKMGLRHPPMAFTEQGVAMQRGPPNTHTVHFQDGNNCKGRGSEAYASRGCTVA